MFILKLTNLTKIYPKNHLLKKNSVLAVDNLNLELDEGKIFGLLGPNGAGKTTALNMIIGLIPLTTGEIEIFDQKMNPYKINFRYRIGYLPENPYLPDYYRVGNLLYFYASIFGLNERESKLRTETQLQQIGLLEKQKERISSLSMGQKRALGLCIALINNPDLIILDEPTVYLDPVVNSLVRQMLLSLKEQGKTIIISSHILSEIGKISDEVGIIDKGRLLLRSSLCEITKTESLDEVFLRLVDTKLD